MYCGTARGDELDLTMSVNVIDYKEAEINEHETSVI